MAGLFDFQDPQQIRNDYMRSQMVSPAQMSQQSLLQQLTSQMSNAGTVIGSAGAGMMGLQLPEEQRQAEMQGIMKSVDTSTVEGKRAAAKQFSAIGDNERSNALTKEADQLEESLYAKQLRTNDVDANKAVTAYIKENPYATSEQLREVVAPFSKNPSARIDSIMRREDKALANSNLVAAAKEKAEAARLLVQQRAEDARLLAQSQQRNQQFMQRLALQSKADLQASDLQSKKDISAAQATARMEQEKAKITAKREAEAVKQNLAVLPPSLQKVENENLVSLDSYNALVLSLEDPIAALKGSATTPPLDLGPLAVAKYVTLNSTGNSTNASRAYSALQEAKGQAVNILVGAEAGVQAKDDVTRFAAALVDASAKTDTVATREALVKFQNAVKVKATKTKVNINSQRTAQNLPKYFTDVADVAGTRPGTSPAPNNQSGANPSTATVAWGTLTSQTGE